jgi:uridine kinase
MENAPIVEQLAEIILSLKKPHPIRVGIDGIDASGKTFLADTIASYIEKQGRPVIRASIDGFHKPRAERYKRGKDSPEGYYEDSFEYVSLREKLLEPLGEKEDKRYHTAVFDFRTDTPVLSPEQVAPSDAILIFDGVFLLRPEIAHSWDYHIYVNIDFEEGLRRAMKRDLPLLGSAEAVEERYLKRYYPGQRLYLEAINPKKKANVIVENTDFHHPTLVFPSRN